MQNDKIKYTTKYNKRIYTQLIFFQYYRRIGLILLTAGGIIALILTVGYILSWNPLGFKSFPLFALLYALIVLILPFLLRRKIEKTMQNHALLDISIDFEINSEGIQIAYQNDKKKIKWEQIYKISLHPKAWMIYGTKDSFFYILKSDMSPEEQSRFIKWGQQASKLA